MASLSPFPSPHRRRLFFVFVFVFTLLLLLVINVVARTLSAEGTAAATPFTPKAAVIRYWNRKVPSNRPQPPFVVSKLSPLSAVDSAVFSSLAAAGPSALSSRLSSFCSAAHLLCFLPSLSRTDHHSPSHFSGYENSNYTNYGTDTVDGADSFKNYSDSLNLPVDIFRRYSRGSSGHNDSFESYSAEGNVVSENFNSYATSATGGAGEFSVYAEETNSPDLRFINYDAAADGRLRAFTIYSSDANAGDESFAGYGKNGNGIVSEFTIYADETNAVGSFFDGYGRYANTANDSFSRYGFFGNVPDNTFHSYGDGGSAGSESFASYREKSNSGADSFSSYAKGSEAGTADFLTYGFDNSNSASETFEGYGKGSETHEIAFTGYFQLDNTTFKAYAKSGVSFDSYHNSSSSSDTAAAPKSAEKPAEHWPVEPGKFFRERDLRSGNVMPMPDILDKMPARSFLPRSIAKLIPFSAAEVRETFRIPADTALGKAVADTVADCERPPSRGETKLCPTSAEELIDFAVAVLGSDVEARSTESAAGSKGDIMIGEVRGVNGGNITRSVSCHQSLFPYMVYYCHSVPLVRLYEAEILAVQTKERINHGIAICHLDTSDWSAGHAAFLALGPGPGKIEVCHWIFEGDMTWTVAD